MKQGCQKTKRVDLPEHFHLKISRHHAAEHEEETHCRLRAEGNIIREKQPLFPMGKKNIQESQKAQKRKLFLSAFSFFDRYRLFLNIHIYS